MALFVHFGWDVGLYNIRNITRWSTSAKLSFETLCLLISRRKSTKHFTSLYFIKTMIASSYLIIDWARTYILLLRFKLLDYEIGRYRVIER